MLGSMHNGYTNKLLNRYGPEATGAILATGALLGGHVAERIGDWVPPVKLLTMALSPKIKRMLGSVPAVVMAEGAYHLGALEGETRTVRTLRKVGGWIHAIKSGVGAVGAEMASTTEKMTRQAGKWGARLKRWLSNVFNRGGEQQWPELSQEQIQAEAQRMYDTLAQAWDEYLNQHPDEVKDLDEVLDRMHKGMQEDGHPDGLDEDEPEGGPEAGGPPKAPPKAPPKVPSRA